MPVDTETVVRGTIPARASGRGGVKSFDYTARFMVAEPATTAKRDEHDRRWRDFIDAGRKP